MMLLRYAADGRHTLATLPQHMPPLIRFAIDAAESKALLFLIITPHAKTAAAEIALRSPLVAASAIYATLIFYATPLYCSLMLPIALRRFRLFSPLRHITSFDTGFADTPLCCGYDMPLRFHIRHYHAFDTYAADAFSMLHTLIAPHAAFQIFRTPLTMPPMLPDAERR